MSKTFFHGCGFDDSLSFCQHELTCCAPACRCHTAEIRPPTGGHAGSGTNKEYKSQRHKLLEVEFFHQADAPEF